MAVVAHTLAPELDALLSRVRVSRRVTVIGADTFVPIVLPGGGDVDAELLDEGLEERHTVLREVSESGDVNRILVSHYGTNVLLLLDGEQIIGAKQNRVFNASFLIAPDAHEVEVAVSCVERGRWAYSERRFHSSDTTLTGLARSRKLKRVTHSVITGAGYDAEQRAVWDDVDDYLDRSRVVSRTSALDDAVASRRDATTAAVAALAPRSEQVGLALVRAGRLVLMDLFGGARLYARAHRKIASGMVSDPCPGTTDGAGAPEVVASALARLRGAKVARRRGPSCGETVHGEREGITLGGVVHAGQVFHLVAART